METDLSQLVVLDVGARWGASSRWDAFADRVRVIGFDPDPEECTRLNAAAPKHVRYVSAALGSTRRAETLHVTAEPACSSLFPPISEILALPELRRTRVVGAMPVDLITIDDWHAGSELGPVTFIKLDTQGSELDILRGAERTLRDVVLLEVEVEFNPMYHGQPLYGDVDSFLRDHGFVLWSLTNLAHYGSRPFEHRDAVEDMMFFDSRPSPVARYGGQLYWANATYIAADLAPIARPSDPERAVRAAAVAEVLGLTDLVDELSAQMGAPCGLTSRHSPRAPFVPASGPRSASPFQSTSSAADRNLDISHLDPGMQKRIRMTTSCRDTDHLPKVPDAGLAAERSGTKVQIMHNGLAIELGCYCGPWMDAVIEILQGHHEPQEEMVFAAILERLRESGDHGAMIELGSFWSYYSMWFAHDQPDALVVAMEPDPAYLDVGRRNARLNALEHRIQFVHGSVGAEPGVPMDFFAESDGQTHQVMQYDLDSLMTATGLDRTALVLADIQGAESILLENASHCLARRVRFLIISTHHHSISGSATTHQRALQVLADAGAHIIAEHSISESFSGDGLIAASFDPRDRDFQVTISHARAGDSLFGGLECDLDAAFEATRSLSSKLAATDRKLDRTTARLTRARRELNAIHRSRSWRAIRTARTLARKARRRIRTR